MTKTKKRIKKYTIAWLIRELKKLPKNEKFTIWGTTDDNGKGVITAESGKEVKNY